MNALLGAWYPYIVARSLDEWAIAASILLIVAHGLAGLMGSTILALAPSPPAATRER